MGFRHLVDYGMAPLQAIQSATMARLLRLVLRTSGPWNGFPSPSKGGRVVRRVP